MKKGAAQMTKSPSLKIMNVHVASRLGDRVSLCCEADGAEYHVWLDVKTGKVEDALYKNPPAGTGRMSEKHFHTRKLSTTSARGAAMVSIMMELYRNNRLLEKFEAQEAAELAIAQAKRAEQDSQDVIRAHAPEMMKALKEVEAWLKAVDLVPEGGPIDWSSNARAALKVARAAIQKVEGK